MSTVSQTKSSPNAKVQSGKIEQKVECGTYYKIILVTGLFLVGKEIVVVGHYEVLGLQSTWNHN